MNNEATEKKGGTSKAIKNEEEKCKKPFSY
jgi:hypothetical protein